MHQLLFALLHPLLFFLIPSSSSQNSPYPDCAPVECGGLNISYPFSAENQPVNCNNPGFPLACEEDVPVLKLQQNSYSVLHINYMNHTLVFVNRDFYHRICPRLDADVLNEYSTNDLPGHVGFLSFYNCSEPILNPIYHRICPSDTSLSFFTRISEKSDAVYVQNCDDPMVVPVQNRSAFNVNAVDPLLEVFSLSWRDDGTFAYENPPLYSGRKPRTWLKIIIGLSAALGSVLLAGLLLVVCVWMSKLKITTRVWKNSKLSRDFENFIGNHRTQMPERYSYSDIRKMTNYLKSKLGEGGFGMVFRGQLLDGRPVAVKILSDSKGKGEDFINEVAAISRTSHVNIVRLVGFCFQGSHRALVYEFMANGSLEKFIFDKNTKQGPLGWEKLFQIAVGIARGLEYLHRGCNMRILHFDIKPHNILLDQDFCPKISDFGLAKLCPDKESIVSMTAARGTMGYIAPEVIYRRLGGVSQKSDVYSYGMLLLEMVGGRKNIDAGVENTSEIYFPDWIYNRLNKDRNLQLGNCIAGPESETARKLIMVGLWCIQTKPMDRPTMSKVVEMLEGNLQVLQMPPKPFLYSLSEAE